MTNIKENSSIENDSRVLFNEGYNAYKNNKSKNDNPYDLSTYQYRMWKFGFKRASEIE